MSCFVESLLSYSTSLLVLFPPPQSELDDTTGVELIQGRSAGCIRPMIKVKNEKIERAANYTRVMKELTMLGAFIRMADYMFVEGVINR